MKKKVISNGSGAVKVAIIGASLAGLAAGAYFFFGPNGKKNQKHAKAWAIKMKGDVVEKFEMANEISEPVYQEIIDSVATEYVKGKKASREEIEELAKDLKKHWKTFAGGIKTTKRDIVNSTKKVAKKAKR